MTYCQNKVTDRWAVWRQSRVQAPYSVIAPPLESHGRQLYRLAMPSPAAQRTIAVSHSNCGKDFGYLQVPAWSSQNGLVL